MKKSFFASLTNSQKVMLIVALVGGTCAVIAACVGLGTPIVSKLLDLFIQPTPIAYTGTPTIFITPTTFITPTPVVVYKLPAEMNLQPGDIPSLQSTDVQSPDANPLIPNATAQDQVTFKSTTKDISIESNVYLLPSATQMTTADIYDLVVPKRRPNSQKAGSETPVKIGDNATIIQITDSCGNGYVLILEQNNVVVVIIGCGHDLDENLITQSGTIIDNHITISHEAECAQLKLTAEECANLGTHNYSMSGQITSVGCSCSYGDGGQSVQRTETLTIFFSADSSVSGGFSNCTEPLHAGGTNTYPYSCTYLWTGPPNENSSHTGIITFNSNGFTNDYKDVFKKGGSCTWHEVYTLNPATTATTTP